jgi:hypothetical protein
VDYEWKNTGLNVVGQWGKAFGGSHHQDRRGDAIWLGFRNAGDPAVICAAAVQQHMRVFRSVALPQLTWGLYIVVNHDPFQSGDGGNAIGLCLDRAAKLVDEHKQDMGITERVLLTPEAVTLCSPPLQELMVELDPVQLAPLDDQRVHFVPSTVDIDAVMASWCERVSAAAASLVDARPVPQAEDETTIALSDAADAAEADSA